MIPEICPSWFQGFNLAFQIVFFLITTSIALTAYRVYKFFDKEEQKYLSLGWALLALNYLISIIASTTHLSGGMREIVIVGMHLSAYLFLGGIMVLLFAYLHIKDSAVRIVLLVFVFGLIAILSQPTIIGKDEIFHLVVGTLMLLIVGKLKYAYRKTCTKSALFVTVGFAFLTAGQIIMVVANYNEVMFVLAALATLFGLVAIASRHMVK